MRSTLLLFLTTTRESPLKTGYLIEASALPSQPKSKPRRKDGSESHNGLISCGSWTV